MERTKGYQEYVDGQNSDESNGSDVPSEDNTALGSPLSVARSERDGYCAETIFRLSV
jgi:hypothetical protein